MCLKPLHLSVVVPTVTGDTWEGHAAPAHAPSSHVLPLTLDWLDARWLSSPPTSSVRRSRAHLAEGFCSRAPAFGTEGLRAAVSKQIKPLVPVPGPPF